MEQVQKAVLNLTVGANLNREDLSNLMSLTDGPSRPLTQNMPQTVARNITHQWNEQGLNVAGRNNVAALGATYAEGVLPPANSIASNRKTNAVCRVGRLAQVTDSEMAAFNAGGTLQLAEGEMERQIQNAADLAASLATIEVLNQIEWMHWSGDSSNNTMEGKETDGLIKWAHAGGSVVATGGTNTTPVTFIEQFIKDGARAVTLNFPSLFADTLAVSPELMPDFAGFVANGASRPLVQVANGNNIDLVAGASVAYYNTGYRVLKVVPAPYLSPAYNTAQTNSSCFAFNSTQVQHAALIPLRAEPLARIGPALQRMITCEFAQEHRIAKHTFTIENVKSGVA
jgi:hypothetical protein